MSYISSCSQHSAFSHFFLLYQFNKQLVSCYTLLLKRNTKVLFKGWNFSIALTLYMLPYSRRRAVFLGLCMGFFWSGFCLFVWGFFLVGWLISCFKVARWIWEGESTSREEGIRKTNLQFTFLSGSFICLKSTQTQETVAQYFLTMTARAIIEQLYCNIYLKQLLWCEPHCRQVKPSLQGHWCSTCWHQRLQNSFRARETPKSFPTALPAPSHRVWHKYYSAFLQLQWLKQAN